MHADLHRLAPDDPALAQVLALIRECFAYMDGRIDPPSSVHRLDLDALAAACRTGEVWYIGTQPQACIVMSTAANALYLGKLAVKPEFRGAGLARRLIDHAADRARSKGLTALELQSRVELTEIHQAFLRMGFTQTGSTAHAGYTRPTSLTFRKPVCVT